MVKYGEALANEIVKDVNNGEKNEALTKEKVEKLCELKNYDYTDNMIGVILSNS